jgi:hypothetical protein
MVLTPSLLVLGSKHYSAAIAFTLALFSHLINHVNIRLQAELEEGENPVSAFQSDGTGSRLGEVMLGTFTWDLGVRRGSHTQWEAVWEDMFQIILFSVPLP